MIPNNRLNHNQRATIYCSKNLNVLEIPSLCCPDAAVGLLQAEGQKILLVSAYMDINLDILGLAWFDKIISYADQHSYAVLLGIDTNAHSTVFGPTQNARGDALEELMAKHGLNIHNIGETPTF